MVLSYSKNINFFMSANMLFRLVPGQSLGQTPNAKNKTIDSLFQKRSLIITIRTLKF